MLDILLKLWVSKNFTRGKTKAQSKIRGGSKILVRRGIIPFACNLTPNKIKLIQGNLFGRKTPNKIKEKIPN